MTLGHAAGILPFAADADRYHRELGSHEVTVSLEETAARREAKSSMERLVVLTEEGGFFGQTRKPWVSLDVGRLCRHVEQGGIRVERATFGDVGTGTIEIRDSAVFFAFSQKENSRRYLTDIVLHLSHGSNLLIPSFDLLMCHENKGYQELFRRQRGLPALAGVYLVSSRDVKGLNLNFPVVLKTVDGSNGKGVFLARDRKELLRITRRIEPRIPLMTRLDLIRRKHFRRQKRFDAYPDYSSRTDYAQYREYIVPRRRVVLQEYIPGLEYDFRVLALGGRFFVMKRQVRAGDFRASGTKLFEFDADVSVSLLDFAHSVEAQVDAPFLSMDICPYGCGWALLEFQALHFGVSAVKKGPGYFARERTEWQFQPGQSDLEAEMARALVEFLAARGA